ncbi:MAG: hypothetical protein V3T05_13160, partial [Myxococcota bacterium]
PRQLADITVTYNGVMPLELAADWSGPRKLCVPTSPAACTTASDCTGQVCDEPRGGCRDTSAPLCAVTATHCASGETCTQADTDPLAVLVEQGGGSAALHRIATSLPAHVAGDYFLRIHDRATNEGDSSTTYKLIVGQRQDPDVNEDPPNDSSNMATEITSASPVTGYFSYPGDVDWYRIDPTSFGVSTTPIAVIAIRWLKGTTVIPAWTVEQNGATVPISLRTTLDEGAVGRIETATWLLDTTDPFTIRVVSSDGSIDFTGEGPYTVTVDVLGDSYETTRDDDPSVARPLDIGSAGGTASFTQTIIAENDLDWYRVDRTGSDNALVRIQASTIAMDPGTDGFLLDVTAYYPTGVSCDQDTPCSGDALCIGALSECMRLVQRPPPDGPGDPQIGGLTPNEIDVQLPVFASGTGAMYIRVRHLPTTFLPIPGFSASTTYTLTLTHRTEPDSEDATNPDNNFITRPLMGQYGVGKEDYFNHSRNISLGATGVSSTPRLAGDPFAVLAQLSQALVAPACTALTIEAYDGLGAAGGSINVNVSASLGSLHSDAGCSMAHVDPLATSGGSGTIYYLAPATAQTVQITTQAVSFVPIQNDLAVYVAGTPPGIIEIGGARDLDVGGLSAEITVTIPATAALPVYLLLQTSGGTTVTCYAQNVGGNLECTDIDNGVMWSTNPCDLATGSSSCQLPITTGTTYGFQMSHPNPGVAIVRVTDTDTIGPLVGATWAAAASTPPTYSYTGSAIGSGYISYEGDADFWTLDLPADMPKGEVTAIVTYAGSANLRMAVTRDSSPSGYCSGTGCGVSIADASACGGVCTAPGSGDCSYTFKNSGSNILNVWVNDNDHDDWDITNEYSFTVSFAAGCPAACVSLPSGQYICSQ